MSERVYTPEAAEYEDEWLTEIGRLRTELATARRQLAEREAEIVQRGRLIFKAEQNSLRYVTENRTLTAEVSRLTNSLTTAIENYELAKQSRDTLQAKLDRVREWMDSAFNPADAFRGLGEPHDLRFTVPKNKVNELAALLSDAAERGK